MLAEINTTPFLEAVGLAVAAGVSLYKAATTEWTEKAVTLGDDVKKRSVGIYTVLTAGFAAFLVSVADKVTT